MLINILFWIESNPTPAEKTDETTKSSGNDAVGVNLDKDLLESLVNLENELTGLDTRKTLAEGSRLCEEISLETNKIAKLIDNLKTEQKPSNEEIQQAIAVLTAKVNDLVKKHNENNLTDKAGKFIINITSFSGGILLFVSIFWVFLQLTQSSLNCRFIMVLILINDHIDSAI